MADNEIANPLTNRKWLPSRASPLFPSTASVPSPRSTSCIWGACSVCLILMLAVIGYLLCERSGFFGLRPAASDVSPHLSHIGTLLAQTGPVTTNVAAVQAYLQTLARPPATLPPSTSSTMGGVAPAVEPPRVIRPTPTTSSPPSVEVVIHRTLSDRVPAAQARGDGL